MATPPSTTVLKAFELLGLFTERKLLGAGEAARLLGAPRASTHRLLVTLKAAGVLESNSRGQYRLGLRLFELGSQAPVLCRLLEESRGLLDRLASDVGLSVSLAVRDGMDLVHLERIQVDGREGTPVGERSRLHASAAGKVLLAYAPKRVLEWYLGSELPRYTPRTVIESGLLLKDLREVRSTGLGWDREEMAAGESSVATTVRDQRDRVVAAIAVTDSPTAQDLKLRQATPALRDAALVLQRRLGWSEPDRIILDEPKTISA